MRALALFALCQGCVIVPKTRVVPERAVMVSHSAPACALSAATGLAIETHQASVLVRATRQQTCRQEIVEKIEGGKVVDADVEVGNPGTNDPRELLAAAFLAPITMVISGLITVVVMEANHRSAPIRKRIAEHVERVVAAGAQVELVLPSGRTLAATTDAAGVAKFAIPDDESEVGVVSARVDADRAVSSRYYRTLEPCTADRAAIFARASQAPAAARRIILGELPECGDAQAHAWQLMRDAALEALAGRCASIERSYAQVRTAGLADAFAGEPDLAGCLREFAAAHASVPARP
jgi:hypothetical protein